MYNDCVLLEEPQDPCASVCVPEQLTGPAGVKDTVQVVLHPFAPLTVTVYEPAIETEAVAVVCEGLVFHE